MAWPMHAIQHTTVHNGVILPSSTMTRSPHDSVNFSAFWCWTAKTKVALNLKLS